MGNITKSIGAIVEAVTDLAIAEGHERREADDRELDAQIGVTEGEVEAPVLEHPPVKISPRS